MSTVTPPRVGSNNPATSSVGVEAENQTTTVQSSEKQPSEPSKDSSYSKSAVQSRLAEHNIGSVARQLQIFTTASQNITSAQQNVLNDQLRQAASKNDLKQMEDLIKQGADINSKDQDGRTPLMHAAEGGSVQTMEALVKKYKADVNAKDDTGQTALMKASIANKAGAVNSLIDLKAKVDARDDLGNTALILAAGKGNKQVADSLIDKGNALVDATNTAGRTALMEAIDSGNNNELIRDLSGISKPDIQDKQGNTALMLLIRRQQTTGSPTADREALNKLILGSKNLNLQDNNGRTALMEAGRQFDTVSTRALIDAGADLNVQDNHGQTMLMHLINNRMNFTIYDFPGIDSIIEKSALDVRDKDGKTAMIHSATRGDDNTVKKLHLAGANLDIQDYSGKTALMQAATAGHKWVVKALLETDWQNEPHLTTQNPTRKADVHMKDQNYKNALSLAENALRGKGLDAHQRKEYEEIVELLRKEMDIYGNGTGKPDPSPKKP